MRQVHETITIRSKGQGHHDITNQVSAWLDKSGLKDGVLTILIQHVSAALALREGTDRDDLHTFFAMIEGYDDRRVEPRIAPLYASQMSIPVHDGRMDLGARQRLHMLEYREAPHSRQVVLHMMGE